MAKTAATLQLASGGRLMLGVAVGWYEREFEATAVPFHAAGPDLRAQPGPDAPAVGRRRRDRRMGRPGAQARADAAAAAAPAAGAHRRVRGQGAAPRGHPLRRLGDVLLHRRVHRRARGRRSAATRRRRGATGRSSTWSPRCRCASAPPTRRPPAGRVSTSASTSTCSAWSEATPESAVRGTPEQCAEQIAAYLDAERPAPGLLPVQLRGRAGAPAGRRGAAAGRRDPRGSGLMEQVTVLAARAEREAAGRPVVDKRVTAADAVTAHPRRRPRGDRQDAVLADADGAGVRAAAAAAHGG